jgi:hypothetical protein
MRKITFILIIILASFTAKAQNAFQKKDLFVSLGLSGGNYRDMDFNSSERAGRSFPIFLSGEYGVNNTISVGPYVGYYFWKYRYVGNVAVDTNDQFMFKSHHTVVGLRGTYHMTPALEKLFKADMASEDLDIYITGLVGYELNSLTRTNNSEDMQGESKPVAGIVIGARYFLNYRFALFGELGPGTMGLASLGVTARF